MIHFFVTESFFVIQLADSTAELEDLAMGSKKQNQIGLDLTGTLEIRARLKSMTAAEKSVWRKKAVVSGSKEQLEAFHLLRENVSRITATQFDLIIKVNDLSFFRNYFSFNEFHTDVLSSCVENLGGYSQVPLVPHRTGRGGRGGGGPVAL